MHEAERSTPFERSDDIALRMSHVAGQTLLTLSE
jgi:hypothetical protein